jgi:hypothetical protein
MSRNPAPMTSLYPETSHDIDDSNLDSWTLVDFVAKAASLAWVRMSNTLTCHA